MVTKVWQRVDRRIVILAVLLIALAAVLNVAYSPKDQKTVTAMFPRAVSVYKGTDVRILGVTVGRVTAVTPEATRCASTWSTTRSTRCPATPRRSS